MQGVPALSAGKPKLGPHVLIVPSIKRQSCYPTDGEGHCCVPVEAEKPFGIHIRVCPPCVHAERRRLWLPTQIDAEDLGIMEVR